MRCRRWEQRGLGRAGVRAVTAFACVCMRRFSNEDPPIYADWKEFFKAAQAKSGPAAGKGVLHAPDWNIEAGVEDGPTLCSVCPLAIPALPKLNRTSQPLEPWTVDTEFGPVGSKWHATCGQTCLQLPPDGVATAAVERP
eukprot:COSAG01_NODE_1058_length_11898_cov_53.877871_7_plen_140_part_00